MGLLILGGYFCKLIVRGVGLKKSMHGADLKIEWT